MSLASVIDLPPKFPELAGVEVPDSFQGKSLLPILRDPAASVRDLVFAERNWHVQRFHERMVRSRRFVYIRNHLPNFVGFNYVNAIVSLGKDRFLVLSPARDVFP